MTLIYEAHKGELDADESFAACFALRSHIKKLRKWVEEGDASWRDDLEQAERAYAKIAGYPFDPYPDSVTAVSELLKSPR